MGVSIVTENDLRAGVRDSVLRRYVYEDFKGLPDAHATATPFGDPTGTAGNVNTLRIGMNEFQYHILGTQTIVGPKRTTSGLNVSLDVAAADDGFEYTLGNEDPADTVISSTAGQTRGTFVVGTDGPFFVSVKFLLEDVSGTDDCAVGFHKAEAYQAAIDSYDEAAFLNAISGNIYIETILNGGSATSTDTTDDWADGAAHTFMVLCDSDGTISKDGTVGKCYFSIDGAAPTTEASSRFKFDSGEVVIPFMYFIQDTDLTNITFQEWESGLWPVGATSLYGIGSP